MNTKTIILILLIFLFSSVLFAQPVLYGPASFRFQSTFILEDDLDLVQDPIDIFKVDGSRLYTTLSNISSGTEAPIANVSDNRYVLGISGYPTLFGLDMRSSFLTLLADSTVPHDLDIDMDGDGFDDIWGTGYLSGELTEWLDMNGDGTYDVKRNAVKDESDEFSKREHRYIFVNSFNFQAFLLGFRFSRIGFKTEDNTAAGLFNYTPPMLGAPSFSTNHSDIDLASNETTRWDDSSGTFLTELETPINDYLFSIARTIQNNVEVRLDLEFATLSDKVTTNDIFTSSYNEAANTDSVTDTGSENETVDFNADLSGTGFGTGTRVRYTFKPVKDGFIEGRMFYRKGSLSGDCVNNDHYVLNIDSTNAIGNIVTEDSDFDIDETYPQENSYSSFVIGGRGVIPFNNLSLGLGMYAHLQNYSTTQDITHNEVLVYTYNDGDAQPNDPDDYTSTTTSSHTAQYTYENKRTTVSFPVGLEYAFTKQRNWKFRIGALTDISKTVTTMNDLITGSTPTRVVTVYEDGTTTTTVLDEDYTSSKESATDYTQTTIFSYGLGWDVTENLQADFIAFFDQNPGGDIFDLNTYRNLKLSVTLKF